MGFEKVYITKLGLQLEAKSRIGKNIKILRVDVGDGELTDNNITERTSLIHKIKECKVNSLREIDNETIINFILQQSTIEEKFYFREFGVIAEEPDTKEEILYMYANAESNAELINDKTSTPINDRIIDIVVKADNTDNISISIDNTGVYIEREEYEKKVNELKNDVNTKFDNVNERIDTLDEKSEKLETDCTKKINDLKQIVVASNAGAHNAIYRGEDITDLFYNGTLTTQIAEGTFDDIFIGDYIIGKVSGRKYLVADINYRLNMGSKNSRKAHVLMIPEKIMGRASMNNETGSTDGAYVGSDMYTTNLEPYKTTIKNDFGAEHILKTSVLLQDATTEGYESKVGWYDSEIELMNENMVYGSNIYKNRLDKIGVSNNATIDTAQLSLFRYRHDLIATSDDKGNGQQYWLRDVYNMSDFAGVDAGGQAFHYTAYSSGGVRPTFLIY